MLRRRCPELTNIEADVVVLVDTMPVNNK